MMSISLKQIYSFPFIGLLSAPYRVSFVLLRRKRQRKGGGGVFNEICIYEAKIDKQDEIETLMKEVAEFYLSQPGVIDVKYIKRTHRQEDFKAVKEGKSPIRLTKWVGKVTYILHWTLEDEETHARVSKLGLEQFYKRWNRCLTTMPKIILGENIV